MLNSLLKIRFQIIYNKKNDFDSSLKTFYFLFVLQVIAFNYQIPVNQFNRTKLYRQYDMK